MSDPHNDSHIGEKLPIEEKPAQATMDESVEIGRLFALTEPRYNPWRADFDKIVTDCYNFKELRQWSSPDIESLKPYDVPSIAVDRINRVLDVVDGVRENTGNKVKVTKRSMGNEAVATILDKVRQYVYYTGDFDLARDEAFSGLKDVGIGMRKIGYDPTGEGEIWCEAIQIEEIGWSYTRKKNMKDVRWYWEHHTMDWEDAVSLAPAKAGEIRSLKATQVKKWEEMKGGASKGQLGNDYQTAQMDSEQTYSYPDQVHVWEIWVKKITPYKIIAEQPAMPPVAAPSVEGGNPPIGTADMANTSPAGQIPGENLPGGAMPPVDMPLPKFTKVPHTYEPQQGQEQVSEGVDTEWMQSIIVSSSEKKGGILLTPVGGKKSEFDFDPYIAMISQFKKSGAPRGLIEICIPHQIRANIAWAQKTASNNKSIKSPIVTEGNPLDIENVIQQSRLGAYLNIPVGTKIVQLNQQPPLNAQALEEINSAKEDMDFAAAASEPVMRGQSQSKESGISISKRQDAAVTSINKWVKAEKDSELVLARKVLKMIIKKFTPEKMARIVGEQFFYETLGYAQTPEGLMPVGIIDPITMQPKAPPVPLPLQLSDEHYDCIVQDEAVSDFNKQQSFNAAAALHEMGFTMDGEYMIANAPLKNPEEAMASYMRARNDIIKQLQATVEMLAQQLGIKQNGGGPQQQHRNAKRGKAEPQRGSPAMLGGTGPGAA